MKTKILLLMIIGILFSCSSDDENETETIEMRINHFQSTGMTIIPVLTLLVQEEDNIGTDIWTKFYSNIEGFNYESGTIYNLSVKSEPIDNPPADVSSHKYTLIEIKSTQVIDNETLFDIDLKINGENFVTTDNGLKLLNQINIDCNNLCVELDTILQNQDFVIGTFKRISDNEIKLIELE
ncbi:DUF4377 domain-containing protein [Psychroflexus sp. MES1-P1E]|uniref:DUF4377 domain-containing protein n=1 Tax=Psychroflexus sp. MES1-P1E TaxID=2058320 RepID=UPI0021556F62|nr:DUF4377 domain-containing protein [Psychroflexus sp. MES1-P1E]